MSQEDAWVYLLSKTITVVLRSLLQMLSPEIFGQKGQSKNIALDLKDTPS
jgi:hypothetical protein